MRDAVLTDADTFLTRAEAAKYLRRSVATLERWSKFKEGPRCRLVGGKVLYSLADLRAYVASNAAS